MPPNLRLSHTVTGRNFHKKKATFEHFVPRDVGAMLPLSFFSSVITARLISKMKVFVKQIKANGQRIGARLDVQDCQLVGDIVVSIACTKHVFEILEESRVVPIKGDVQGDQGTEVDRGRLDPLMELKDLPKTVQGDPILCFEVSQAILLLVCFFVLLQVLRFGNHKETYKTRKEAHSRVSTRNLLTSIAMKLEESYNIPKRVITITMCDVLSNPKAPPRVAGTKPLKDVFTEEQWTWLTIANNSVSQKLHGKMEIILPEALFDGFCPGTNGAYVRQWKCFAPTQPKGVSGQCVPTPIHFVPSGLLQTMPFY